MARLKEKYRQEVVPKLMEVCGFSNIMQVPKLEKIVLNIGLGEAIQNAKALEAAETDLEAAKRGMLMTNLNLASGMSTAQKNLALEASMGLQNWYLGQGGFKASTALQNAMLQQQKNQLEYNQKMNLAKIPIGIGVGMLTS